MAILGNVGIVLTISILACIFGIPIFCNAIVRFRRFPTFMEHTYVLNYPGPLLDAELEFTCLSG